MIKALLPAMVALTLTVSVNAQETNSYGKAFKIEKVVPADELASRIGDRKKLDKVVVEGEITAVCQAAGCWMKLKNSNGQDIFVKFKDHEFLVPKDLAGRKAYVFGQASKKLVSIEDQRHYAEDAGKSEEEIAAITEPKEELRIDATGVVIQ